MKKIALALMVVLSVGCSQRSAMTNDEIIAEKMKCEEAGMDYMEIINGFTLETTRVKCVRKL
jgi:hypothetical protein